MPEIKKLTMDCPSCEKFFIIAYHGADEPEVCPFCGCSISDEIEQDEEIIDEIQIEDDFSVDTYDEEDSYEN